MIPVGTLCIIVERPENCDPPSLSGRFCTVAPLRRGQPFGIKCNIRLPADERTFAVWAWNALRPIVPPPDPVITQHDKELEAA